MGREAAKAQHFAEDRRMPSDRLPGQQVGFIPIPPTQTLAVRVCRMVRKITHTHLDNLQKLHAPFILFSIITHTD